MEPHSKHIKYQRKIYSMRQVRDCVEGSDAVKRSAELYLPMPSGMSQMDVAASTASTSSNPLADRSLSINEAPWYHPNAAYSAYLHRAKFPDMTASTLRGLIGVATRNEPEYTLPSTLSYLEDVATIDGDGILALYSNTISEILQVGRHAFVIDIREDSTLYIAQYSSESYINWLYEVINGKRVQTFAEFETCEQNEDGEEIKKALCYSLEVVEENGPRVAIVRKYTDGKLDPDGEIVIKHQGKMLDFLPIVNIGCEKNTAEPDNVPLIGITDCALDIYRHTADLNNIHFMCCNPTLVFIGVDADDSPRVVGSTVAIALSDPSSDAKYVQPEAGALDHVSGHIDKIFEEAVHYGAQLLGPTKRAAESAEALALRQASSGATLVTVVEAVGEAMEDALKMAAKMTGSSGKVEFEPNTEFAELALSAQEINSMLQAWMSGGISHLTFLENMANAGKLGDRTPEEEQDLIEQEGPALGGGQQDGTTDGKEQPGQQTDSGESGAGQE